MPRSVNITVPAEQTEVVLEEIRKQSGVLTISLLRSASLQPPGDIIVVELTNRALHPLMQALLSRGIGAGSSTSVTTTEPSSIVSNAGIRATGTDVSEGTWEEMQAAIAKESNMTVNGAALMAVAGFFAGAGLATGTLHFVIAGMLIAPGFEPISRIALGLVNRHQEGVNGLIQTAIAYGVLIVGAALVPLLLQFSGAWPPESRDTYLASEALIRYWTSISLSSLLVSMLAAFAGALVISINRSVLTAGVMVALALIPAAALVGLGLASGDLALAGQAAVRWLIDVTLVALLSIFVFSWKRARVQKRNMSGDKLQGSV